MTSFKKNLFVVLEGLGIALLGAWVAGLPLSWLIAGITLLIPAAIFILYLEDLNRKAFTDKSLLTAQYYWGGVILFGSIVAWFYASQSETLLQQGARLGLTFFLAILVVVWFAKAYKHSIQSEEERELEKIEKYERKQEKKWERLRKKVQKATKDDAVDYLSTHLAYHLSGDSLDGDLNFNVPLAVIGDEPLTYNQILGMKEDEAGVVSLQRTTAYQYIQNLVQGKE